MGNFIQYEYLHDEGSAYLKKIVYNGNENGLQAYSEIVFHYDERQDEVQGYEKGKKIKKRYLLSGIAVYHRQMLLKEYKMDYAYQTNSVLRSVRLYNANGEEINETQFEFGTDDRGLTSVSASTLVGDHLMSAEINGDGMTDLISVHLREDIDDCWQGLQGNIGSQRYYWRADAYLNSGGGSFQKISIFNEFESGESAGDCIRRPVFNKATGDFNGDGFGDVAIVRKSSPNGYYKVQFFEFNPATTSFKSPQDVDIYFNPGDEISGSIQLTVADFNRDGIDDLLCSREMTMTSQNPVYDQVANAFITKWQSQQYQRLTWWSPSSSGGTSASTFKPYGQTSTNADSIYVTDINGNGIPDIALVDNQTFFYEIEVDYSNSSGHGQCKFIPLFGTPEIHKNHKLWFGEFNGDGKTDILRYNPPTNVWQVLFSKGSSTNPFEVASYNLLGWNEPSDAGSYIYKTADFDGDGLTDVMETRIDGSTRLCTVYYKTIDKSSSFGFIGKRYSLAQAGLYWLDRNHHLGDFNGDGAADILVYHSTNSTSSKLIEFGRNNSGFLSRVRDGLGNITTFNYEFFSPYSGAQGFLPLRAISVSYPHAVRVWPMQLVKTKEVAYAGAHTETETYDYTDPVFHATGLGFQGFKTVEVTNSLTNFTKTLEGEFVDENMFPKTTTLKYNSTLLSKSHSFNRFVDVTHSGAQPDPTKNRVLQNYRTVSLDYVKNISSASEVKTYDQDFNPLLIESITYNANSLTNLCDKTTKAITYTSAAGVWYPSFPEVITITRALPGSPDQSVQQKYTYFAASGKVKDNISFFGLPKALSVSSVYDGYGNLTSLTKTSQGVSRSSTFNYKPGTVQMIKETNNIGQEKEYAFHQLFDKSTEETDILGNTVSFEYGGNGDVEKSVSPTGIISTFETHWASGNGDAPANALFYRETISSEGSPDQYVFYNAAGQVLREVTFGLNNEKIRTDTEYDSKGRLWKQSEPYKAGQTLVWISRDYDNFNRLWHSQSPAQSFTYTYVNNGSTVTNQQTSKYKKTTRDASGKVLAIDDNGRIIAHTYGQTANNSTTTIEAGANTVVQTFDIYGRQTQLNDADAGQITYDYNGFGEMTDQIENAKLWQITYDNLGRMATKTGPEGAYTYAYGQNGPNSKGQITKSTAPSGIEYHYYYDSYGRLTEHKEKIDGVDYSFNYGYGNQSALISITYPSGFEIKNVFDGNGYLTEVKKAIGGGFIWRAVEANASGQLTKYNLGNGLQTQKTFDAYHFPKTIKTGIVQDLEYSFESTTGNLEWRADHKHNLTENFDYDDLHQLTEIIGPADPVSIGYTTGRMDSKEDVGNYFYQNDNNQVSLITENPGSIPGFTQDVQYTAFNKIAQVNEDVYEARLVYGPDQMRKTMEVDFEETSAFSRIYVGDYEIEDHSEKGVRRLHYISGGDGLAAIYVMNEEGEGQFYYTLKDYLGSILTLTDEEGSVVEEYSFDAWGRRRNPTDWTYNDLGPNRLFDRGFTGHEHLFDGFNIINMNGRIYDPTVGMMMSVDNFVQDHTNVINYNRYAYVYNNPLKYTDPDGETVWVPIIIGAIVGAYIGGSTANGTYNPGQWDYSSGKTWGYMIGGAVVGGVAGHLSYAVATSGMPFANTSSIVTGSFTSSVGMHIVTGGQTDVSVGFGFGSYNFDTGKFGYLGKKGNGVFENIGYGLGTLANVADILAGPKPGNIELRTENTSSPGDKDIIGHSQLVDENGTVVDWGPDEQLYKEDPFRSVPGTNTFEKGLIPAYKMKWDALTIDG